MIYGLIISRRILYQRLGIFMISSWTVGQYIRLTNMW
jgi:hypothetical protein